MSARFYELRPGLAPVRRRGLFALSLLALFLAGCRATLLHDLPEGEANAALRALSEAGIWAEKAAGSGGRYDLEVGRAEEARAIAVLEAAGLPRAPEEPCEPGALFPSPEEEEACRLARLAYGLARDLEAIAGVVTARVEIAPSPRAPLLSAAAGPAAAAVLYRYRGEPPAEEAVRALVSAALGGLPKEKIEILAVAAPAREEPAPLASVGPFAVAAAQAGTVRLVFWAMVALMLGLLAPVVVILLRRRRGL